MYRLYTKYYTSLLYIIKNVSVKANGWLKSNFCKNKNKIFKNNNQKPFENFFAVDKKKLETKKYKSN